MENFRTRGDGDVELALDELFRNGISAKSTPLERAQAWSNFNYRIVEVAMMFLLPLAASPSPFHRKRSTSALGVFLSIVFIVTYHKINQYAQSIGSLGKVDPFLALWGPFLLAALLIGWMYNQTANVPGGQPIGAIERQFSRALSGLVTLVRKLGRKPRRVAEEG